MNFYHYDYDLFNCHLDTIDVLVNFKILLFIDLFQLLE